MPSWTPQEPRSQLPGSRRNWIFCAVGGGPRHNQPHAQTVAGSAVGAEAAAAVECSGAGVIGSHLEEHRDWTDFRQSLGKELAA